MIFQFLCLIHRPAHSFRRSLDPQLGSQSTCAICLSQVEFLSGTSHWRSSPSCVGAFSLVLGRSCGTQQTYQACAVACSIIDDPILGRSSPNLWIPFRTISFRLFSTTYHCRSKYKEPLVAPAFKGTSRRCCRICVLSRLSCVAISSRNLHLAASGFPSLRFIFDVESVMQA